MASNESFPVDVSIASNPNNIAAVPSLLREITEDVDALSTSGNEARKSLVLKVRNLAQCLETPRETMTKHCWAQV